MSIIIQQDALDVSLAVSPSVSQTVLILSDNVHLRYLYYKHLASLQCGPEDPKYFRLKTGSHGVYE